MPGELLQDAVVTAAALGASLIVIRRLVGVVAIKGNKSGGCDHCASAPLPDRRSGAAREASGGVHPLTVVRSPRR